MRTALAALAAFYLLSGAAAGGVLERAKETGELRIGYRTDAQPFSAKSEQGIAQGYSVDLCRAVARETAGVVGRPELRLVEVEVTVDDRFESVRDGRVDLLCEATTVTLTRRAEVDFSLPIFATGATLAYRKDGPARFEDLTGQKVGVLGGTTTEDGLGAALEKAGIAANVVEVASHADGVARLASGELAAYFGDGAILLYNLVQSPHKDRLRLADVVLSFEPYALALPKGDGDFRLTIDRTLARLARSGDVLTLFERNFGAGANPSELIRALWMLNQIPD
jgi:polar amino acid transport system substrate-binding protein/glutamate/aspartate transport system substrate-binding protein